MNDDDRCRIAALRILGYRFNSEAELRRKLRVKKFEPAEIEATVAKLREEKWLDDSRFAAAFVRMKVQKRLGRERIRRELIAAGVDEAASRQALDANVNEASEREGLLSLCAKKRRALERRHGEGFTDTPEGRKKLAVYLLNQGYDAALVSRVVRHDDE